MKEVIKKVKDFILDVEEIEPELEEQGYEEDEYEDEVKYFQKQKQYIREPEPQMPISNVYLIQLSFYHVVKVPFSEM